MSLQLECISDFCGGAGNPVLSNGFSATSKEGTISKMFTEELIRIADRDPLHDLTIQVQVYT